MRKLTTAPSSPASQSQSRTKALSETSPPAPPCLGDTVSVAIECSDQDDCAAVNAVMSDVFASDPIAEEKLDIDGLGDLNFIKEDRLHELFVVLHDRARKHDLLITI